MKGTVGPGPSSGSAPQDPSGSVAMEWTVLLPLDRSSDVFLLAPSLDESAASHLAGSCRTVTGLARDTASGELRAWRVTGEGAAERVASPASLLSPSPGFDVVVWQGTSLGKTSPDGWPGLESAAAAVRPGGSLYFRLASSRWGSWNPIGWLARRIADRASQRSPLRDLSSERSTLPRSSRGRCRAHLRRLGFPRAAFHQAFPNLEHHHFVLPLDHPGVVDYLLSHLVPRKTRAVAAVLETARLANRLGMYAAWVPVWGVTARKEGGHEGEANDS